MTAVATTQMSDRLITPLRRVARRKWRVDSAVAICKTLALGLFCLLPAALLLGRFDNLWMPARVALSLVAWLAVAFVLFRFSKPVFRRWSLESAALLIERDHLGFDERLSSAVELAGMDDQGSPALLAHLIRQAEVDADSVVADQIVPIDRVVRWSILLAPVVLCWLTLSLLPATRHMTIVGARRVLMPWKSMRVDSDPIDSNVVHPLPQITAVEVRCDYPAYTGLAAVVFDDEQTTLKALVGSRLTFTIRTTVPVNCEKSMLDFSNIGSVVLRPSDEPLAYHSQFLVTQSTKCQFSLTSDFGLSAKDPQQREVIATADQPPGIVIVSPEPRVTVGENDTVPVKFVASDDFGITRIDALVQVDNGPINTIPVNFKTEDKRSVRGQSYNLVVADVLKPQNGSKPGIISYQLRATDNREPDPQTGSSTRQELKIDYSGHTNFETNQDKTTANDLKEAIRRSIDQLNHEQQQMEQIRQVDARQSPDQYHRRELDQAASEIEKTSQELTHAADQAKNTVFETLGRQLQDIADKSIQSAADDAAQANLNQDKGQERQQAAERAVKEIAQARDSLQKLQDSNALDKQLNQAEAVRDLKDAAQKQQEAADLMKSPEKLPQHDPQSEQQQRHAMRDQQQANEKLQEAMRHSEALRDPQAQSAARQLQDVIRKVDQAQKQQQTAAAMTEKQKSVQDVQQSASDLAGQQEALNQEVAKVEQANQDALQHANANAPSSDQQRDIVKALNRNQIADARNRMQHSAEQLRQAVRELENAARTDKTMHDDEQHAADQMNRLAQKQAAISQAAERQQQALTKLQNAPHPDHTVQQQQNAVDQTKDAKKAAEQMVQQSNDTGTKARANRAEAKLAQAQEHAARAADAQKEAARHQQQADDANSADEARAAQQETKRDLAQAQEQQQAAQNAMAEAQAELRNVSGDQQVPASRQAAAQAAQEAAEAQKEASQQNPAAARQAANALARASQAMAQFSPGMNPGQDPPPQDAQNPQASQAQGPAYNPHEGISIAGLAISLPASVLDMGINADQWAVLPPLMKKDLVNAAQQSGLPAYRQMMREYFARVAKMQESSSDGK